MTPEVQTWLALGVVALAALWLVRRWWTRRHHHEGCDCPGARGHRELSKVKKRRGR